MSSNSSLSQAANEFIAELWGSPLFVSTGVAAKQHDDPGEDRVVDDRGQAGGRWPGHWQDWRHSQGEGEPSLGLENKQIDRVAPL